MAALALGGAGGWLAAWIGMPLPWMLGAMIATTLGAMAQAPIVAPAKLRILVIPVIGVLLGSGFTAEMLGRLADWTATVVILPIFLIIAFATAYVVYRRVGRFDPVTAYYASAPGGLNDMMIMGAAAGGDERRIALAHASRILVTVTFVVLFYGFVLGVGGDQDARPYTRLTDLDLVDAALLIGAAIAGVWIGKRIGLPAAPVLGPMIVSGALHVAALTDVPPPTLIVNAAQWVIGTTIGCRFRDTGPAQILREIGLAVLATGTMLAAALAAAYSVAALTTTSVAGAFLAFSPGGLPEMSLLALSIGADGAYVATAHIARIALIIAITPMAFKWLRIKR